MSEVEVQEAKENRPTIKTPQELVHIKHRISLRQYKYWLLMLRAYREAYEFKTIPNEEGFYRLSIATLKQWLGYEPVRSELRVDLENMRREPIIYNVLGKDGNKILRGAGFISEWEVSANWVGFKLPGFLMDSIEQLDLKTAIFQKINWEVFNSFTGKYEALIYKLCRDYIGVGSTPEINIQDFREYMGVRDTEYALFKDFSKFVVLQPVKRINASEASDIAVEAQYTREAKKVVAVRFVVLPRRQTIMDLGSDLAFRFALVTIPLSQQKKYLESNTPLQIESSIQRANEYVSGQEEKNNPVSNIGALYKKAIEENWGQEYLSKKSRETEKTQAQQEKTEQEKKAFWEQRLNELNEEFLADALKQRKKALSLEQRNGYARDWLATPEGHGQDLDYDWTGGRFKSPANRIHFENVYLAKVLKKSHNQGEFLSWLQEFKKLDPDQLGIVTKLVS